MGLLLVCGDKDMAFGSYSRVHVVRKELLEAYINFLRGQEERDETFLSSLKKVVASGDMDYKRLEKLESDCEVFEGVKIFIDHEDGEGSWCSYDAEKILGALQVLRKPYLQTCHLDIPAFVALLKHSVRTRESILFM